MDELVNRLFEAVDTNRSDVVNAIVTEVTNQGGADVLLSALRLKNDVNTTVLHLAINNNQVDIVRTLLFLGASLQVKDGNGRNPLQVGELSTAMRNGLIGELLQTVARGATDRVASMIDAGVDVNASDGAASGNAALHWAASFADTAMVQLLLDRGAAVNAANHEGGTALHDAVRRGHADIVQVLLAAGADPRAVGTEGSYKGATPLQLLGKTEGAEEIRALFEQVLASDNSHTASMSLLERFDQVMQKAADSMQHDEEVYPPANGEAAHAVALPSNDTSTMDDEIPEPERDLDPRLKLLWPTPQRMTQLVGQPLVLPQDEVEIYFAGGSTHHEVDGIWEQLQEGIHRLGSRATRCFYPGEKCHITCRLQPDTSIRPESYRLIVEQSGAILVGGDLAGLRHAAVTLLQLLSLCNAVGADVDMDSGSPSPGIPPLRITDYPILRNRGFMLDISRDKVPSMTSVKQLIDLMSNLKMNQLQLYMEHTFAYSDHRVVWQDADPFTPADVIELDEYCHKRGIALVPNQNSCGHFHRFLKHERYRHLAECPDGIDFGSRPAGPRNAPFSLCPVDTRSVVLVSSLYDELFPHFRSSTLAHVGLDETVDIGQGRSREACQEAGAAAVYMDYLRQVREACRRHGRTMMFWSDMLFDYEYVIAMEWGYEEDHPYDERCAIMADAGVSFYVCPGTSSWNSLTGRTQTCIRNIQNAIEAAVTHNALGCLLTEWGDFGHTNAASLSFPGLLTAAGLSWNNKPSSNKGKGPWGEAELATLLNVHVFRTSASSALGETMLDLGNTYLHTTPPKSRLNRNGTALFRFYIFPNQDTVVWDRLEQPHLRATMKHLKLQIKRLEELAEQPDLGTEAALTIRELRLAADFSVFACLLASTQAKNQAPIADLPATTRTDLANRLLPLLDKYQDLWLQRNRRGGLKDSCSRIEHTLNCLLRKGSAANTSDA